MLSFDVDGVTESQRSKSKNVVEFRGRPKLKCSLEAGESIKKSAKPISEDERFMSHFTHKLVPLFDNLEKCPFPQLVLKYCDPDLARSCFMTLTGMHCM